MTDHDDVTADHDREARSERWARWGAERARSEICPDCERWNDHEPWCPALSLRRAG